MHYARRHKWSSQWSRMMDQRDWVSTTPESSRKSLAAWHWLVSWWASPSPRPKLVNPKLSHVLPERQVVAPVSGGPPCVVVGKCRWGAVTLALQEVGVRPGDVATGLRVWRVAGKAEWVHVADYKDWEVIPTTPCSPCQSRLWFPSAVRPGVFLAQTAAPVPMLKYMFGQRDQAVALSFNDLRDLADIVGVDTAGVRSSREGIFQRVAMYAAAGDGLEAAVAFAKMAAELSEKKPDPDCFVDPLTEAAFDELDPNEQKEFGDLKQKIARARKTGRIAQARKRAAAEMEEAVGGGRGRGGRSGRGRGRGFCGLRGRGRAQPVVPEPAPAAASASGAPAAVPQPAPAAASASAAAAAPAPPAQPLQVNRGPRDPLTDDWASGGLSFSFTRRRGPQQGWIARCGAHDPVVNARGTQLSCTREMSESALLAAYPALEGTDLSQAVLHQLKHWCIGGLRLPRDGRSEHTNTSSRFFPRYVDPARLPTLAELDASLIRAGSERA